MISLQLFLLPYNIIIPHILGIYIKFNNIKFRVIDSLVICYVKLYMGIVQTRKQDVSYLRSPFASQ